MTRYIVTLPIYGAADFCVYAETEEKAIEKAKMGEWDERPKVGAWDIAGPCKGNVCSRTEHDEPYVMKNE